MKVCNIKTDLGKLKKIHLKHLEQAITGVNHKNIITMQKQKTNPGMKESLHTVFYILCPLWHHIY